MKFTVSPIVFLKQTIVQTNNECSSDSRQTEAEVFLGAEVRPAQGTDAQGGEPHKEQLSDTVSKTSSSSTTSNPLISMLSTG